MKRICEYCKTPVEDARYIQTRCGVVLTTCFCSQHCHDEAMKEVEKFLKSGQVVRG